MKLLTLTQQTYEQEFKTPEKNDNKSEKLEEKDYGLNIKENIQDNFEKKESIETPLEKLGFEVFKRFYNDFGVIKKEDGKIADPLISDKYIDWVGCARQYPGEVIVKFRLFYNSNETKIHERGTFKTDQEEYDWHNQNSNAPKGIIATTKTDNKGFRRDTIYDMATKTLTTNEYQNNDFTKKISSKTIEDEASITGFLDKVQWSVSGFVRDDDRWGESQKKNQ